MNDAPYHDHKIYHRGHLFSSQGDVSPLCSKTPRKINLKRELWTIVDSQVTCPKCLKLIAERNAA